MNPLAENLIDAMIQNKIALDVAVEQFKIWYVERAIEIGGGNHCRAAELIGAHRNTVQRHLQRKRKGSAVGAAS